MEEEMVEGSPEDMKYAHAEHMALAQRAFMKKWKSTSPSKTKVTNRVRTCYNCGNQNHFIVECPYERVEDHNGRLVRKEMKPKSYPPRNPDKKRVIPNRALVMQEEYPSGDDASDGEELGMATIAIAKTTSSSSLFASPMNPSAPTTMRLVSWLTLLRYHLLSTHHTKKPIFDVLC
jgi:hypothetical protein